MTKSTAAENFLKSLTRTAVDAENISKRKVISSIAELVNQQTDPTVTLMAALSQYSHKSTVVNTKVQPVVSEDTSLAQSIGNVDELRFGKVLRGFHSLGEYLAHLPNIPGSAEVHIKAIANANHQQHKKISSKDFHFGFKDAAHLDKFGKYLEQRGAFVISDNEILFGDDKGRPVGILTIEQNNNLNKPLDQFTFELTCGDSQLMQELVDILEETTEIRSSMAKLSTITGVSAGGLEITEEDLDPATTKMAGNCFYPWMMGTSVEDYIRDFLESDANVLVLYGPPGTGKSSMLTTAITKLGLSALITSNSAVASNPEFLSRLGQRMAGEHGKYDMVIVEDADSLMVSREKGNDALSQLLNATSGISQKLRFKLVLTSNQKDNSNIDPALLRHGRCFDRMLFGTLNEKQANAVRAYLGRPPLTMVAGTRMTLAEVINSDIQSTKSLADEDVQIVKPRFPLRND